jgi:hypothetical protein
MDWAQLDCIRLGWSRLSRLGLLDDDYVESYRIQHHMQDRTDDIRMSIATPKTGPDVTTQSSPTTSRPSDSQSIHLHLLVGSLSRIIWPNQHLSLHFSSHIHLLCLFRHIMVSDTSIQ